MGMLLRRRTFAQAADKAAEQPVNEVKQEEAVAEKVADEPVKAKGKPGRKPKH